MAYSVDVVVHAAGHVDLLADYDTHEAINVRGTIAALEVASRSRGGRLHFVGSASASAGAPEPNGGYDRSKWIAARLVLEARARGLSTLIHYVGEAMPHQRRGIANARSLVHSLLQSGAALGMFPPSTTRIDYAPVDQIAEAVSRSCVQPDHELAVQDLRWPHLTSFADVVAILRSLGVELEPVPHVQFIDRLRQRCTATSVVNEFLIAHSVLSSVGSDTRTEFDPFSQLFPYYDAAKYSAAAGTGFEAAKLRTEPIADAALHAYALHLTKRAQDIRDTA
jgi:thioester reductase-like protein